MIEEEGAFISELATVHHLMAVERTIGLIHGRFCMSETATGPTAKKGCREGNGQAMARVRRGLIFSGGCDRKKEVSKKVGRIAGEQVPLKSDQEDLKVFGLLRGAFPHIIDGGHLTLDPTDESASKKRPSSCLDMNPPEMNSKHEMKNRALANDFQDD